MVQKCFLNLSSIDKKHLGCYHLIFKLTFVTLHAKTKTKIEDPSYDYLTTTHCVMSAI